MRPIPFYREDQRRGAHGRWVTEAGGPISAESDDPKPTQEPRTERWHVFRQEADHLLQRQLDGASLPPPLTAAYGSAFRKVLDSLTLEGLSLFHKNVATISFQPDFRGVTDQLRRLGAKPRSESGTEGFYMRAVRHLALDGAGDTGENAPYRTVHLYAHEIGHALDGTGSHSYSATPEWQKAWQNEIVQPRGLLKRLLGEVPLSNYAKTSPAEGWAEFHRALVVEPEVARKRFPLCYQCWQERGLV
jgi:hypothetical protein